MDINSAVGRRAGLSDEKLLALFRSPRVSKGFGSGDLSVFNDKERLIIELADRNGGHPVKRFRDW